MPQQNIEGVRENELQKKARRERNLEGITDEEDRERESTLSEEEAEREARGDDVELAEVGPNSNDTVPQPDEQE